MNCPRQEYNMSKRWSKITGYSRLLLIGFILVALNACSGDGLGTTRNSGVAATDTGTNQACLETPDLPECSLVASLVTLRADVDTIKSDSLDAATITAYVLDENRAAMEGVQVNFSANVGRLSKSIVFTDENGEAVVEFTSSPEDPSNQVATITATVANVGSDSIPITIAGTTLEIDEVNSSLQIPAGSTDLVANLVVIAKDAAGQRIYDVPINFSIAVSGTATGALSVNQQNTDTRGEVKTDLTVSGSGGVTFQATGLGTEVTKEFAVTNVVTDNPFRITSPTTDPYPLTANGAATVAIDVAAAGVTTVRYTTTIGFFVGSTTSLDGLGNPGPYIDVAVGGGVASATLSANPGDLGFATVVASDASNPTVFDSMTVAMSPPASLAALIMVQSDLNVLPPSNETTEYKANLTAKVVTDDASGNYPIFNVPVIFTLSSTTGGGEVLSNSYSTTDLNGQAHTVFTSGTLPSGQNAVRITATVANTTITDFSNITIGGTGGSVAIGTGTEIIEDEDNNAVYNLPMSVEVADSDGNPVAGSNTSLSLWPLLYHSGVYYDEDPTPSIRCAKYVSGTMANEDLDEDLILDQPPAAVFNEDINADGMLTPPNSSAGTIPSTVITNEQGVGYFENTYLKAYANWVTVRARGATKVMGTETQGSLSFLLPAVRQEMNDCVLSPSPFPLYLRGQAGGFAHEYGNLVPYAASTGTIGDSFSTNVGTMTSAALGDIIIPVGYPVGTILNGDISVRYTPTCTGTAPCVDISFSFPIRVEVCAAGPTCP